MTRSLQSMTLSSVLLLAAAAAPALADQGCKPVVGSFEAVLVVPGEGHCPPHPEAFCTAGRVWGGVQGKSHAHLVYNRMNSAGPAPA